MVDGLSVSLSAVDGRMIDNRATLYLIRNLMHSSTFLASLTPELTRRSSSVWEHRPANNPVFSILLFSSLYSTIWGTCSFPILLPYLCTRIILRSFRFGPLGFSRSTCLLPFANPFHPKDSPHSSYDPQHNLHSQSLCSMVSCGKEHYFSGYWRIQLSPDKYTILNIKESLICCIHVQRYHLR
jgi:hypothetical protein